MSIFCVYGFHKWGPWSKRDGAGNKTQECKDCGQEHYKGRDGVVLTQEDPPG